ncbi:MAG: hypothetical protein H7308_19735 [Chthonomonadaceae bacterium]|nr:hypothetical protein [Chthonomonadaceae bacterium]
MSEINSSARVFRTAPTDFVLALSLAQNLAVAWDRTTSLAAVARYAPEAEVILVAEKALKTAQLTGDMFKQVAASAWVVRALVERARVKEAEQIALSLLKQAEQIEHPVSKTGALTILWGATWIMPTPLRQRVLNSLLAACLVANSWRSGRTMRYVALVVANEDRPQAQRIIDSMRDNRYKRGAQQKLDAGQTEKLGKFF